MEGNENSVLKDKVLQLTGEFGHVAKQASEDFFVGLNLHKLHGV